MENSLNNRSRRCNLTARTALFDSRVPGRSETGNAKWPMTKANASTKLGIAFAGDSQVAQPIPVLARPGRPPVAGWFFPPTRDGNKGVLPTQTGDMGTGVGGIRKRKE